MNASDPVCGMEVETGPVWWMVDYHRHPLK